MRGFVDLHSHWVAAIDDGVRDVAGSLALLRALHEVGFDRVVATPHMRPGMFENSASDLRRAFDATEREIARAEGLPERALSSEHFFDDVVYRRLLEGHALPYPGGHSALVEFPTRRFPANVTHCFFELMRRGLRPVLAHPERYEPVWDDITVLDRLVDGGTVLLLDVAALAGKYGRAPRRAAEALVEAGYYQAACSDAHGVGDAKEVREGIKKLFDMAGKEEAQFLLEGGPRQILEGTVES